MTALPTVDTFLQNLWAAQMNLDADLMMVQKAWETGFWTDTVKKSSNSGFEKHGFNVEYWETKASDRYVLLNVNGAPHGTDTQKSATTYYTRATVTAWIATKVPYNVPNEPAAN
jgi:hypothetical protein